MNKWVITRVKTDEFITIYNGTFMEVMEFASHNYEDGEIDIELYDNYTNRKIKEELI